jgi:hypothetical protein
MSEWHSAKINCPRSHCLGMYHIFISLNDEGVMGKSRPKLLSSYNVSSSALPIPPMLSSSRHPFRGLAFNCRPIDKKSRATSLFLQGPKDSQFSATGPWISLSFFFFRPFLVWNAQWTWCGFLPNDVKGRGLRLTHIPPGSLRVASFARMLSAWCKALLSFWMIMLITIIESREMHRIGHEWLHN